MERSLAGRRRAHARAVRDDEISVEASVAEVSAQAVTLLLAVGGGFGLFIGIAGPPEVRPAYSLVSGAIAVVLSALMWWRRRPVSPAALHAVVCVGTVAIAAGAYLGRGTFAGEASVAFYLWPVLLVFGVFRRTVAVGYLLACIGSYAIVLAAGGTSDPVARGTVLAATMAAAGVVVGALRAALHRLAVSDPLTGLGNRQSLMPLLRRALAEQARRGRPLTVGMLDLDDFKGVNDTHGHRGGDELLVHMALALRAGLAGTGEVLRIGGDEFVLVLPGVDPGTAYDRIAALALPARCSLGLAAARPGDDPDAVLQRADTQLYRAKAERDRERERLTVRYDEPVAVAG